MTETNITFSKPQRIDSDVTMFTCGIEKCDLIDSGNFCNRYLRERISLKNGPCLTTHRLNALACCFAMLITNNIAENDFDVCSTLAIGTADLMKELTASLKESLRDFGVCCPTDEEGGPFMLVKIVVPVYLEQLQRKVFVYHFVLSFEDPDDADDLDALIYTFYDFLNAKGKVLDIKMMPFNFFQGVDLDDTYDEDSPNVFGNADDVFVPLPLTDYYDYC